MAHNPDDFDEIPSIVPERDELVSHHRKVKRSSAAAARVPVHQEVVSEGTSGMVIFFLTILTLGLLATGGAGYYFYKQGLTTQDELLSARNRLMQLESRLNLVDEAASENALNLVERVDFNFSEIDKLWAARNTLRTEVTALTNNVATLKTTADELETAVGNHENLLSQTITSIQARIDEINRNFAGMDNLGQQLTVLNADLNRVKTSMATVEQDVENRLQTAEQDIESINVYRLQVNQTLSALQDSINRLQQRVGP
jgi:chromosome segregation ATPase